MIPDHGLMLKPHRVSHHPSMCLTDLDFADDIALLSLTTATTQALLCDFESATALVGLTSVAPKPNAFSLVQ